MRGDFNKMQNYDQITVESPLRGDDIHPLDSRFRGNDGIKESPLCGDNIQHLLLSRVQPNPLHPFGGTNIR